MPRERQGEEPDHLEAGPEALRDAGQLSGTQVLGSVVGDAVGQGGEGGDHEVVELDGGGVTGHDAGPEAVDDALDHDIADGDEALLQDAGDGNLGDFGADAPGEEG